MRERFRGNKGSIERLESRQGVASKTALASNAFLCKIDLSHMTFAYCKSCFY